MTTIENVIVNDIFNECQDWEDPNEDFLSRPNSPMNDDTEVQRDSCVSMDEDFGYYPDGTMPVPPNSPEPIEEEHINPPASPISHNQMVEVNQFISRSISATFQDLALEDPEVIEL